MGVAFHDVSFKCKAKTSMKIWLSGVLQSGRINKIFENQGFRFADRCLGILQTNIL